jgi:amino acid transporter
LLVAFFSGWEVFLKGQWALDTFVTNYLPLVLFPLIYVGARLYYRHPTLRPEEIDLMSGLSEVEQSTYDEPPPRNFLERFWQWLV